MGGRLLSRNQQNSRKWGRWTDGVCRTLGSRRPGQGAVTDAMRGVGVATGKGCDS